MTLADRIIIMKDGFIEQIGTPIDVFTNPVNVFVATFIGSPPMNVIECDVIKEKDELFIKIDSNMLMPCPSSKKDILSKSSKVFVGIRAEDIVPSENSTDKEKKGWNFEKSIDLAEPLGTETQLFFKLNNKEIISRMYNPRLIKVGEKINFEIDITKIHFFDHETEKAI
jgi:multiple sugar transport system ATP-binding protein